MFAVIYLLTCTSLSSINNDIDENKLTYARFIHPNATISQHSNKRWDIISNLFQQINFVTINSNENAEIGSQFQNNTKNLIYAFFLPGKATYVGDTLYISKNQEEEWTKHFFEGIIKYTNIYPMISSIFLLSPNNSVSIYNKSIDPIFILYNSVSDEQIHFLDSYFKKINKSKKALLSIGLLDCSIYPSECLRWSPNKVSTPYALLYTNEEVIYTSFTEEIKFPLARSIFPKENNKKYKILESTDISGSCGENVNYTFNNGVLTIYGSGYMSNYNDVSTPWHSYKSSIETVIIQENVKSIGSNAFSQCSNLRFINLSDTIEEINQKSFYYTSIQSLKIPDQCISIGSKAFSCCNELVSIEFSNNLISIGNEAFSKCYYLESIDLPKSITSIEPRAFYSCYSLKFANISSQITTIEKELFSDCTDLESVYISSNMITMVNESAFYDCKKLSIFDCPGAITYFADYAFSKCEKLSFVNASNDISYIGKSAFYYCNLTSFNITGTITSIPPYAFYSNRYLSSVTISDSVTSIYEFAFCNCFRMKTLNIPRGVTHLGKSAFDSCNGLTSIDIPEGISIINESVFADIYGITSIIIPESVEIIGVYAFKYCYNVNSITIPKNVKEIRNGAFSGTSITNFSIPEQITIISSALFSSCSNLSLIVLHDNIEEIESSAFESCESLTNFTIPKKVTKISSYLFYDCIRLSSVTLHDNINIIEDRSFQNTNISSIEIPNGVTSIQEKTFYDCRYLTSAKLPNTIIYVGVSAFENCYLCSLNIPDSIERIRESAFSNILIDSINLSNLQHLGRNAFYYCKVKSAIINCNFTKLEDNAFLNCGQLKSIIITGPITVFGSSVFGGCMSLKQITLPKTLTSIEGSAFYMCPFETIDLPNTVTSFGNTVFHGCRNLKNCIIPDGVTSIGSEFFKECTSLEIVHLPNSTTTIAEQAFMLCSSLLEVTIPEVTYIGSYAFYKCTSLKSIDLNDNLDKLRSSIFSECTSLLFIIIPKNVSEIGYSVFKTCSNLTSVIFNDNLTFIGEYAFKKCTSLKSIVLPENINSIERNAFAECSSLTSITYLGVKDVTFGDPVFTSSTISINVPLNYMNTSFCGIPINKINTDNITVSIPTPIVPDHPSVTPTIMPIEIVTISDDTDEKELDKILNGLFDNMTNDENSNKVIVYKSQKINFNSSLDENEFIQPLGESKINYKGGNLNLILPTSGEVSVVLNNDESNLSINGEGSISLEIPNLETKSINLTCNSHINGPVVIAVPTEIDSITINSIEFDKTSSINLKKDNSENDVKLNVLSILVNENTNVTLSNAAVLNDLTISQSATMNLDKVSLENAKVNFEMDFKGDNWNPYFKGNFDKPPDTIILNKVSNSNSKPTANSDYLLIAGDFEENMCEEWLQRIDYGNSGFNFMNCQNNDNTLAVENKKIVLKANKTDKKLSAGQIAGIVVGVVAGVAIIIIAVIFIIKKKKGRNDSESQNQIEDPNDL